MTRLRTPPVTCWNDRAPEGLVAARVSLWRRWKREEKESPLENVRFGADRDRPIISVPTRHLLTIMRVSRVLGKAKFRVEKLINRIARAREREREREKRALDLERDRVHAYTHVPLRFRGNCSALFIKSIPRTHPSMSHVIMIPPLRAIRSRWPMKRGHRSTRDPACGAVEKKKSNAKGQSRGGSPSPFKGGERVTNGGDERYRIGREIAGVPGYYPRGSGPASRPRREKGPSRPRNSVSGLWFFIRARSHNGGSRSDPRT